MKNYSFLICLVFALMCGKAVSQDYIEPQWKFHFAFEDATGARDTVWIFLDSLIPTGNQGMNADFGEVPYTLNDSAFNVFVYLNLTEVSKVRAFNIETMAFDFYIYATNHVYPLTLSWDTTLFFSQVLEETEAGYIFRPTLDNDYFFDYHDEVGKYHMIYESQVELPWFGWWSQEHFPLYVSFERGFWYWWEPPIGTRDVDKAEKLKLYPNPAFEFVSIESASMSSVLEKIDVFTIDGKFVMSSLASVADNDVYKINVRELPPGMYVIHAVDIDGSRGSGKFVKLE